MILVLGELVFQDGEVERLRRSFAAHVAASRVEPGCEHYALARDLTDHGSIRVSEIWRDRQAQAAHSVSDQMGAFNLSMRGARLRGAMLEAYEEDGSIRKLMDVSAQPGRDHKHWGETVIALGTGRFDAGEVERLQPMIRVMVETTRAEDGCARYSLARDVADDDLVHIAGHWHDEAALAAHLASPHRATFADAAGWADVELKAYRPGSVRTVIEV